ncbi:maltose regulon modulator maly [Latilactobacillus sakei subsp. sakei DSM 20017 = JCM 1157]|uniref:cysteine-S-conjugate beta-lyase n=1 Tax=Latilactobacillus sakei TaxID=1599 RepID=A0A223K4L6_LATSK|nr:MULTISPECIES: aminotransferase class I/II-fold pyridoxal phosphate-dependent enzyme [Lactobacillaceae]AST84391.1 beta-cystathionase [Latilactobacillus sakei]AWZ42339.1 beta-cystathionase [Latilactobacillus sakei]AWZ45058.1 beta-cystathionase [Latilactobacillus sakei]AWZ46491.1 beta-cystathionase [Latilactobacillus sakei]AYG15722.1 aminotransferase class I/II-fold pyridoxal phosphate-dependent enzyme [Latilactobacillus sakei]
MTKFDFDTVINRYGTYSTQWDYVKDRFGEANLLPFTISDMDFKAPKGVSDVIIDAANRGVFGYTRWNNNEFKSAIVDWFLNRYQVRVDAEAIVYSPSVIFSLAKLIELFSKPHEKIVTFSPCYDAFINTVTANDRQLIQMDITNGLVIEKLEHVFKIEHPKILLLCNPQNPLGIVWSSELLQTIVRLCNAYNVAVISDEIHMDVVRKGVVVHTIAEYFSELTTQCAVITSASKSFNIPALGCSYALIPDELMRLKFLYELKQKNAVSSVPYLGMLATIECYNHQEDWLNQLNDYVDDNFKYLQTFLKEQLNLDYQIPDATYLAWIDIRPLGIPMTVLQEELIKCQKVAIMDGRLYGNGGSDHLRYNLGASRSKVEEGLNRLLKAVEAIQQR